MLLVPNPFGNRPIPCVHVKHVTVSQPINVLLACPPRMRCRVINGGRGHVARLRPPIRSRLSCVLIMKIFLLIYLYECNGNATEIFFLSSHGIIG